MLQRLHFFLSINRVALKRRVSERKGVNNQVIVDLFFIPVEMIRPLPRDYERRDTISRWFHVRASAKWRCSKMRSSGSNCMSLLSICLCPYLILLSLFYLLSFPISFLFQMTRWRSFDASRWPQDSTGKTFSFFFLSSLIVQTKHSPEEEREARRRESIHRSPRRKIHANSQWFVCSFQFGVCVCVTVYF